MRPYPLFRYFGNSFCVAFQKYDPKVDYFSEVIQDILDTGILDSFLRRSDPFKGQKVSQFDDFDEEKLTLAHCYFPLAFWLAGMVVAKLACTVERREAPTV